MNTYEINNRNEVIPYTSGRKCTDTRAWRDATELELQQQDEIKSLETELTEVTEQRDRLAEALKYQKELNEWIESADPEDPFFDDGLRLCLNHASDLATEALQSLNQPEP